MAVVEQVKAEPQSGSETELGAYLYLALMVLVGSSTATAAKFAVAELPVPLLPLVRFGSAGLCLLPLVWRGGGLVRLWREDAGRLALAAALCVPVNQAFFLNASRFTPSSHVAIFYAACPLVVLALVWTLGQERPALDRLAGVLASVSGVALIGLETYWHGTAATRGAGWGDLLLVGAVASWGGYLTVNKPLVSRYGALPVLAGTFLLGSLFQVPVALATLPSWPPLGGVSAPAWRGLAYLSLVCTLLGLAFQNQALRRLDASQVAAFNNAGPLLTVLWGVWLLGESITPGLAVGGALTLGGILWTSRPRTATGRARVRPVSVES